MVRRVFFDAANGALFADKRMIMLSIRRHFLQSSRERGRRRKRARLVRCLFFNVVSNGVGFLCSGGKGEERTLL